MAVAAYLRVCVVVCVCVCVCSFVRSFMCTLCVCVLRRGVPMFALLCRIRLELPISESALLSPVLYLLCNKVVIKFADQLVSSVKIFRGT